MSHALSSAVHRRAALATVIGNSIEWFDYLVFGMLSAAIAHLFFPSEVPSTTIMLGFATFAVSYVARPIGGIVFGIYADKYGRRSALAIVFALMCIGTLMIGILPTYESIGIAAPILLVLSRMVQGFSAGGEFGNATTALIEFAPPGRRGLYGSFQILSQGLTTIAASLTVFLLTRHLDDASFDAWGWRMPFLAGAVIGPVGLYLRLRVTESPDFLREVEQFPRQRADPLGTILLSYKTEVFACTATFAVVTGGAFINTIYLPAVAMTEFGISKSDAALSVLVVALLTSALIPIAGYLSDWFDRIILIVFGAVTSAILFAVLSFKLVEHPGLIGLMLLQVCYAVPYSFVAGTAPAFAVEHFPVRARATGSSLSYNLAAMLFGGMAPLVVAMIAAATGSRHGASIYMVFISTLGVIGVMALVWKRNGVAMHETGSRGDAPSRSRI